MQRFMALGRLTKDPILRKNSNQKDFCMFDLAIKKDKQSAEFINCIVWGKTAINLVTYCKKGDFIAIDGKLTSYTQKIDGSEHSYKKYQINCLDINFVNSRKNEEDLNNKVESIGEINFLEDELVPIDNYFLD